ETERAEGERARLFAQFGEARGAAEEDEGSDLEPAAGGDLAELRGFLVERSEEGAEADEEVGGKGGGDAAEARAEDHAADRDVGIEARVGEDGRVDEQLEQRRERTVEDELPDVEKHRRESEGREAREGQGR